MKHTLTSVHALALVLLLLGCFSHTTLTIGVQAVDPVVRTEWPHLDCSGCLAVAAVLGERMNVSLKQAPGSYLVSHRLDRESSERRRLYKTGELRAVEVLDNMCGGKIFDRYFLRLNPKSKVRTFHVTNYAECRTGNREAFVESEFFPSPGKVGNWFRNKLDGIKTPVAHYYSRYEREGMGTDGFYKTAQVICATFLDECDDDLSTIIRETDWLSEVEEQLCGLNWGRVVSVTRKQIRAMQETESKLPKDSGSDSGVDKEAEEEEEKLWKGLTKPVSNVCIDAHTVRESAELDQRRWYSWSTKRKEKRAAERAAKTARRPSPPPDDKPPAEQTTSKAPPQAEPVVNEDAGDL